jgi:hypothetical protein
MNEIESICQEALEKGFISVSQLCHLLAQDAQYIDHLAPLWHHLGLGEKELATSTEGFTNVKIQIV